MEVIREINYGVLKTARGYAVATSVRVERGMDGVPRLYYSASTEMVYKKMDFAMKKADSFVRRLYGNGTDFQGNTIITKFKNVGQLDPAGSPVTK